MSVVEVVSSELGWHVQLMGMRLPETYETKAAAEREAKRLARRRQATLRVENGSGWTTTDRYRLSEGYR